MKKRLAIVGTGIAGMASAYFLKDEFDITVFEKDARIGGHTNTVSFDYRGDEISFDTGFMVFNEVTYPNLIKLFKKLEVDYYDTSMSFSVFNEPMGIEYNGSSLNGLFSQRKNLVRPSHYKMILNINKFNQKAPSILADSKYDGMTVAEFVEDWKLGEEFLHLFLIPMSSAVWSTPAEKMLKFPIQSLVRFFFNHGFMGLNTQHQWKTITGGSKSYRDKLINSFIDQIKVEDEVLEVLLKDDQVEITSRSGHSTFDYVIMASHADQSLKMRKNPTVDELRILSAFKYQKNMATIHTDHSIMPKLKENWSSWNYVTKEKGSAFTVYYMNSLQKINHPDSFFININGEQYVDPSMIISQIAYEHPVFDIEAVRSQEDVFKILNQEKNRIKYCGAWTRYGFHEDGILSAVRLCSSILGREVL
ncbi:FAD-dependent oxidoreductase [Halobacteriovorax sp. GB3]|uniref:NAD(P)/FAD-dependent oxidoreductase n=1 Tax=Halobacteriovorax sp. GB3 TaxID=2719615 RepID=UPI002360CA0C|nr:FAD-dependent oxidoreductase [Halobacteriovorax sp. GB3]MDD0851497.1 FAD-dependent oxidoreductase [Halobacteriovorax sp. GB3]